MHATRARIALALSSVLSVAAVGWVALPGSDDRPRAEPTRADALSVIERAALFDPAADASAATFEVACALSCPELGGALTVELGAELKRGRGDRLDLSATLVARDDPNVRYALTLRLSGRADPHAFHYEPDLTRRRLPERFFVDHGGTIDERDWEYYRFASGELVELGELSELSARRFDVVNAAERFTRIGVGANGWNCATGLLADLVFTSEVESLRATLTFDVLDRPALYPRPTTRANVVLALDGYPTEEYALWGPATWMSRPDGSTFARLTLRGRSSPRSIWELELELSGRSRLSAGGVRAAQFAGLRGRLRGLADCAGAIVHLVPLEGELAAHCGPSADHSAHELHARFVAQREPGARFERMPETTEGRLRVRLDKGLQLCALSSPRAAQSRALRIAGSNAPFRFDGDACFRFAHDGSASLSGALVSCADANDRWQIDLTFSGRRAEHWRAQDEARPFQLEFDVCEGFLHGAGDNTGALLKVDEMAQPFRVGRADAAADWSGRALFGAQVLHQPDGGRTLPWFLGEVELTIDLRPDCGACEPSRH